MMLLLHVVTTAAAVVMVGAAPAALQQEGRALGWLWDSPHNKYTDLQAAGEPPASLKAVPNEVLQEEGRRRNDNRPKVTRDKPSKSFRDEAVSTSGGASSSAVNKDTTKSGGDSSLTIIVNKGVGGLGHNTPVLPVPGKPIFVPGVSLEPLKPETVEVPVDNSGYLWSWDWLTGLMENANPWTWSKPTTSIDANIQGDFTINQQNKPFGLWWPKPSLGNYVPTTTLKPVIVEEVTKRPEPSRSEVMVLRYPEFLKTIGRGIKKMTNAVQDFGYGMSESLANKFDGLKSVPTAIGSGVAAIIPLGDGDKKPETERPIYFPTPPPFPAIPKPQLPSLPALPSLPSLPKPNLGSLFGKPTGSVSVTGSGSLSVNSGTSGSAGYGAEDHSQSQSTVFVNKFT